DGSSPVFGDPDRAEIGADTPTVENQRGTNRSVGERVTTAGVAGALLPDHPRSDFQYPTTERDVCPARLQHLYPGMVPVSQLECQLLRALPREFVFRGGRWGCLSGERQ